MQPSILIYHAVTCISFERRSDPCKGQWWQGIFSIFIAKTNQRTSNAPWKRTIQNEQCWRLQVGPTLLHLFTSCKNIWRTPRRHDDDYYCLIATRTLKYLLGNAERVTLSIPTSFERKTRLSADKISPWHLHVHSVFTKYLHNTIYTHVGARRAGECLAKGHHA